MNTEFVFCRVLGIAGKRRSERQVKLIEIAIKWKKVLFRQMSISVPRITKVITFCCVYQEGMVVCKVWHFLCQWDWSNFYIKWMRQAYAGIFIYDTHTLFQFCKGVMWCVSKKFLYIMRKWLRANVQYGSFEQNSPSEGFPWNRKASCDCFWIQKILISFL